MTNNLPAAQDPNQGQGQASNTNPNQGKQIPPSYDPLQKQGGQNSQQASVPSGGVGPEGQPVRVEQGGSGKSVEAGETLKRVETAGEQTAEKTRQRPQQKKKKSDKKKISKPQIKPTAPSGPKIFGYRVPPQLAQNTKLISRMKGKGDPKTGIACLYVFVDRLLRMNVK